jgi:hypothetical protein
VVDVEEGITLDDAVAKLLRKVTKPVFANEWIMPACVKGCN